MSQLFMIDYITNCKDSITVRVQLGEDFRCPFVIFVHELDELIFCHLSVAV